MTRRRSKLPEGLNWSVPCAAHLMRANFKGCDSAAKVRTRHFGQRSSGGELRRQQGHCVAAALSAEGAVSWSTVCPCPIQ